MHVDAFVGARSGPRIRERGVPHHDGELPRLGGGRSGRQQDRSTGDRDGGGSAYRRRHRDPEGTRSQNGIYYRGTGGHQRGRGVPAYRAQYHVRAHLGHDTLRDRCRYRDVLLDRDRSGKRGPRVRRYPLHRRGVQAARCLTVARPALQRTDTAHRVRCTLSLFGLCHHGPQRQFRRAGRHQSVREPHKLGRGAGNTTRQGDGHLYRQDARPHSGPYQDSPHRARGHRYGAYRGHGGPVRGHPQDAQRRRGYHRVRHLRYRQGKGTGRFRQELQHHQHHRRGRSGALDGSHRPVQGAERDGGQHPGRYRGGSRGRSGRARTECQGKVCREDRGALFEDNRARAAAPSATAREEGAR